jgi:cell division septum initiation protein DivIVA
MATETEIRRELAGERKQLTDAVATLREELGHAADRGKKIGAAVSAAAGAAAAAKLLLRLRRR